MPLDAMMEKKKPGTLSMKTFSPLFFMNNYIISTLTHIWSVAVEFQMYLLSPFSVEIMSNHKSISIFVPIAFTLISWGFVEYFSLFVKPDDLRSHMQV